MANAVALGEIGETQPVPRPHRRAVDSLGGDREKRRVVETIDPDILTPIFIDDNGELPAVRRQARCPERPRLDRDLRGDARTIGPHQRSVRGRRLRPKHQGASRREREPSGSVEAKGNVDAIEQFHGRAGHRESIDVEWDAKQGIAGGVDDVAGRRIFSMGSASNDGSPCPGGQRQHVDSKRRVTIANADQQRAPSRKDLGLWSSTGDFEGFAVVTGRGTPPSGPTCCRPSDDPKMIVPSAAHAPPRKDPAAQITTGDAAASSLIVFSWLPAQKPTDLPSGEKNGMNAPSVPGSAVVVS